MITPLVAILLTSFQLQPMPQKPVETIKVKDVTGAMRSIPATSRATVLFFVATDCPIANRMAPELSRIVTKYKPRGIEFDFVYVDPSKTAQDVKRHLAEFKLGGRGILDTKHAIVKSVGATVTPQAVVLGKNGKMLYRGRINDLFLEHGRSRNAAKSHDLRNALDQFLSGKTIKIPQTPALGCSIPPLD